VAEWLLEPARHDFRLDGRRLARLPARLVRVHPRARPERALVPVSVRRRPPSTATAACCSTPSSLRPRRSCRGRVRPHRELARPNIRSSAAPPLGLRSGLSG